LLHVVPVFLIAFTMREDRQRWLEPPLWTHCPATRLCV
jgi:hypothetical protein